MSRDLLVWAGGLLFVACLLGGLYGLGRMHGAQVTREEALAAENARMTAVSLAVGETVARSNALSIEVERLRARSERVRTITREIRVEADADCRSLPADWLRLWNAEPGDRPDAGAARVDDAGRMSVATH
jgi:hypothetical protein